MVREMRKTRQNVEEIENVKEIEESAQEKMREQEGEKMRAGGREDGRVPIQMQTAKQAPYIGHTISTQFTESR